VRLGVSVVRGGRQQREEEKHTEAHREATSIDVSARTMFNARTAGGVPERNNTRRTITLTSKTRKSKLKPVQTKTVKRAERNVAGFRRGQGRSIG